MHACMCKRKLTILMDQQCDGLGNLAWKLWGLNRSVGVPLIYLNHSKNLPIPMGIPMGVPIAIPMRIQFYNSCVNFNGNSPGNSHRNSHRNAHRNSNGKSQGNSTACGSAEDRPSHDTQPQDSHTQHVKKRIINH